VVVSFRFKDIGGETAETAETSETLKRGCYGCYRCFGVVYHMKLPAYLLHAVALLLPSIPSIPSIVPRMVFVLMRFPASEMRFLSENDVRYAS
jgi:hypothetical protein